MPVPEWVKKWIDELDEASESVKECAIPPMPSDPHFEWWDEPLTSLDASEE